MARDINQWLAELGLAKYAARFAANEIDLDVVAQLSDDDLRSLDIPLGPRKKLLKAIADLVSEPARVVASESAVAPARRHDGERRQLTVMFCDLVDSTGLSTRMDPEDLRDVIRAYHGACAVTVESHGGYVAKYMGDGVMVYFGYPRAHEDDARRAAGAGIAIVHAVAMLDIGRHHAIESPLGVRVGIHTGLVVVGHVIGESDSEPASVTGETPNVASRLQALAGANEVVVGPLTHELMGDAFACDDLGHRVIKELDTTLQVWRVVRERDLDAVHSGRRTHDRLVGRREEVGLLVRAWEASRQGRGQVILIQGESGIGKSRLVDTLRAHAADGDFLWIATRCSPYHASSSLHPVIEHLKRLAGWTADDDPRVRVAKLEAVLRNQSMPLAHAVPLYAALLSLPLPEGSYTPLRVSTEEQRTQTLDALVAWLLEEADHKPVLRVWEDLQWADPTTLELLGMCIEQAATVPMLNVLTYRPEFTPPWTMRSHMTPISLNRLERQEVEVLVTQLAGGKSVSAEVAGYIADKTDGVPLYIEELTKAVLDPRFVLERDGRFELARPLSEVAIPATLHDMLMARLDRFPTIREVAQLGSILGREFAYEMLQAIASLQESELQVGLDQLVHEELLYQRGRRPSARSSSSMPSCRTRPINRCSGARGSTTIARPPS